MSYSPVVTVVIPTYNHAHFLRDALNALCAQTYTDWEAIVVNNFSEDDTVAVVESFGDPRIRLENFRNNGLIGASRNRGIALARGNYVAFLDSDDTWYPEKLMRCVPYLEKGADLVCHALRCIGEGEGVIHCGPKELATFDVLLSNGSCIVTSATLLRKSILDSVGGFSERAEFNTAEDYHLWLKVAKMQASMVFIDEILGEYRIHSGNQSGAGGSVLNHMHASLHVIDEFMPICSSSSPEVHLHTNHYMAHPYYGAGRRLYKNRHFAQAFPLFLIAIRYRPYHLKTYVAVGLNVLGWLASKFVATGEER